MKHLKQPFYAAEILSTGNGSGTTPPQEFVQMTDPVTQATVMVPKNLEVFIAHITSTARSSGKKAIQDERDTLQAQFELAKEELDNLRVKMKDKSESKQIEALKGEYEKMLKERDDKIEALNKNNESWRVKYEEKQILSDLHGALSGYELYNSQQTIDLLRVQGKARLVEKIDLATGQGKGEFDTVLTLNVPDETGAIKQQDLKPREAVEKFLNMEVNAFHIKNKLSPGGGSAGATGAAINIDTRLAEAQKKGGLKGLEETVKIKQEMFLKE